MTSMAPRPHFVSRSGRPRRFLAVLILAIVLAISAGVLYLFVRATPSAVGPDGERPTTSTTPSSGGTGGADGSDELGGTWRVDTFQEELVDTGAATAAEATVAH